MNEINDTKPESPANNSTIDVTSNVLQPPGPSSEISNVQEPADSFSNTPKSNEQALAYIRAIVPEKDFKHLRFDDNLVTISDTGKELGEFTVSVEPSKFRGQECFLIHANSHGAIDGVPCGTSIICHVSKTLETLEQHHHEYVKLENCPLDRKTIIIKHDDYYVVNRVITQGEDVQRTSRSIPANDMQGFISEGSNLLLHRIFIEKGLEGELNFISFDSETIICPAIYGEHHCIQLSGEHANISRKGGKKTTKSADVCVMANFGSGLLGHVGALWVNFSKSLEERTQTIGGVEMRVLGVERTIQSEVDLPTTWQSYFLTDGHLSNRVQVGSPVTMKLQRLPKIIERDEEPPKPVFEKKELNWEEDLQMYSKFLDRKEELKGDHNVYMRHHPELKALLADFLQFLLLRKPEDVITFAAEYFASFSTTMPAGSPYLSSATPSSFPHSRANSRIESLRAETR